MHKAHSVKRRTSEKRSKQIKSVSADVHRTFFALCKNIDTPFSLSAWLRYKYDHEAFVELALDPVNYGDSRIASINPHATPQSFAYDLMVCEYLSKYKGLELKRDVEVEAISAFKSTELKVASVNRQLKSFRSAQTPRLEAIISIARRKISEILGCRSEASFSFGWGPGATFSITGDVGWDRKILEERISVTASALPLASTAIGADIHWCRARGIDSDGPCSLLPGEFEVVPGNRITTVPKNAKTNRTIAIEPTANIYLQKGVGSWIRRRLRSCCRINLDSQLTNRKFAGRLDYATIDLKSASDSISLEVVKLLVPDEWLFLLDALRSPNYYLGGAWHRYAKWSSMGNGYTFELESLLFYSLAFAVQSIDSDTGSHVLVFGDDVLVPVQHAESTITCFETFGFEANRKKTHYRSLYRESCGAHFYNGVLVTPVYQKEVPSHVGEVYHMANRLRHFATRLGGYHYSDSRIRNAWLSVIDCISDHFYYSPLTFRNEVEVYSDISIPHKRVVDVEPVNVSLDGCIHLSIEDCESLGRAIYAYGSRVKYYKTVNKRRPFDQAAGLCFALQGNSSFEGSSVLSLRGRSVMRLRRRRSNHSFGSNIWL